MFEGIRIMTVSDQPSIEMGQTSPILEWLGFKQLHSSHLKSKHINLNFERHLKYGQKFQILDA